MAIWSVTTWLIVICVAVFVIDNLFLAQVKWLVTTGWVDESVGKVPRQMLVTTNRVETKTMNRQLANGTVEQRSSKCRALADRASGQIIGWEEVIEMRPLQAMMHFSTRLGFLGLEFWRFITFQFLHANLSHLLFNMMGLYFFGGIVEQYLGRKRYLAFYLLCGIFGAVMYLLLNLCGYIANDVMTLTIRIPGLLNGETWIPLVGASAGIFGVLMAGAYLAPKAEVLLFFVIPMKLQTLAYALVAVAFVTVLTGGNNAGGEAGHLGGAIAGWYFIRHPHHLHGFFDFLGRADPTSHHYRHQVGKRPGAASGAGDQAELDRILAKISENGLHSLTEAEKRLLRRASEQRGK